ncbi:uncharacterized protein METZ01_LOCUS22983 [marine metagenome]|uniref:Uncharacterized protein n=1 Tax=marine metagenome TaxID=408172 RepID=A0A381PW19_9ZZZZ
MTEVGAKADLVVFSLQPVITAAVTKLAAARNNSRTALDFCLFGRSCDRLNINPPVKTLR